MLFLRTKVQTASCRFNLDPENQSLLILNVIADANARHPVGRVSARGVSVCSSLRRLTTSALVS